MSFVGSNILAGAAGSQGGDAGFKIDRSLRFNSADSAYLNRTPSSAGNRKTWTWSGWIKRNKLGTTQRIFAVSGGPTNDDNWFAIAFNTSNQIFLGGYSTIFRTSTAVYRDVSAWMHCVVSVDLTASTTMKVWINGVEQSLSGSSNPSNTGINNNLTHYLGVEGASAYCDLQLAEVHFIDGQALAPTDFGEFDDNNVWQPKETNITPLIPTGPNKTQDWDSLWTGTIYGSPYAFANVHDTSIPSVGDTVLNTNSVLPANNQSLVLTPTTPITVNTSVVLRGSDGGATGNDKLFVINAGRTDEVAFYQKPSGSGFQDMTATAAQVGGKIYTITLNGRGGGGGNSAYLGSIFVDGRHLETGGPVADVDNTFHLNFSDNSSNAALGNDSSGAGTTLTCVDFDGSDDYLRCEHADMAMGTGDFTVEAFVYNRSHTNYRNYFGTRETGQGDPEGWCLASNSSGALYIYSAGLNSNLTTSMNVNQWYHVAYVRQSGTHKFYVDGTLVGQDSTSRDYTDDKLTIAANSYAGTEQLDGAVSNLRVVKGTAVYTSNFTVPSAPLTNITNTKLLCCQSTSSVTAATVSPVALTSSGDPTVNPALNDKAWTVHNLVAAAAGLSTANQGFDAVTYTGTGSDQAISSLSFQPDFVWIKTRNEAENHFIVDSVRGVTKQIYANSTGQEYTNSNRFKSFDSNGFTVGSTDDTNQNNNTFVAWAWKAGGAASSNTDGSITSSVSANNTYGFSIVKWSNSSSSATIGHGLNAAPALIFTKGLGSCEWQVYHKELGNAYKLYLNGGDAQVSSSVWSTTTPTSSVFNFNDNRTQDFIAYCWSEVSGFSKFGTYTGNGSATGPVITTGFKPRFVLVKGSSYASNWNLIDTARSTSNPRSNVLRPNSSAAEFSSPTGTYGISLDVLDDGFQLKSGSSTNDINQTGATYIYAAFADKPDGSVIDSLIDSPTNYEATPNNGGNYATLNPLNKHNSADTFSEGNLKLTSSGSGAGHFGRSTIAMSSGKYYWEVTWDDTSHNFVGIQGQSDINYNNSYVYLSNAKASATNGSSEGSSYGASWGNGDVIGIAYDADNATLTFYKNGVSQGTAFTSITGTYSPYPSGYVAFFGNWGNQACTFNVNFGQLPFVYTPPTGYKSLCTTNLPDPTIADGSQYFRAITRTGGGTNQSFTTLNPGLVWQKNRGATSNHYLYDKVRGDNKYLNSAATTAEATSSGAMAFSTNGYVVNSSFDWPSNNSIIDWVWDAGTSTVSNTDGSITSSVRANPSAGFSIVKWTGNRSGSTVGHGLNAAVKFYFVKNLDQGSDWLTFHTGLGGGQGFIRLNTNGASGNASSPWNSTVPTSSVFSLGADSESNGNGDEMIAYCFAPVEGYSAFGSFSGNGTSDNVFVYTGFRPKFVLAKYSSSAGDWILLDTSRRPNGPTGGTLVANNDTAEDAWFTSGQVGFDFLSNGFKIRHNGAPMGDSGRTVIYAAFAEHPFKTARAY